MLIKHYNSIITLKQSYKAIYYDVSMNNKVQDIIHIIIITEDGFHQFGSDVKRNLCQRNWVYATKSWYF